MKLMLDTSAYSAFKRSHPGVIVAIRQADEILLPSTVHGELLAGFETGSRTEENRGSLNEFLQSPRVKLVPAGTETAEHYARIYAYLPVSRPSDPDQRSLDCSFSHGAQRPNW